MKKLSYYMVVASICFYCYTCKGYAQSNLSLSGILFQEDSAKAIAGATIEDMASGKTTISDADGKFTLRVVANTGSIKITHISFQTKVHRFAENDFEGLVRITLTPRESTLEAVEVSTGYQQLPKERSTGSFEMLDKTLINRSVSTGILDRLEGVTNSLFTDRRGSSQLFTIRGLSSITAGIQEPLIVLDNMPYQGSIDNINPNDIESISILKDAAAASIWGARAGNGVIVITTKAGQFNRPMKISFNANLTRVSRPDLHYLPEMSSSDFIDVENFLFERGFYNAILNNRTNRPVVSPVVELLDRARLGIVPQAEANAAIDALRNIDGRDQFKQYMYRPEWNQQYALNLSGGNNQMRYLFSMGYDANQRTLVGDNFERITLRTENTFRLHKKVDMLAGAIFTLTKEDRNSIGHYASFNTGGGRGRIYPYLQLADDAGNPLAIPKDHRFGFIDTAGGGALLDWTYKPLEELQNNNNTNSSQHLLAKFGLTYRAFKGFSIDLKYQGENGWSQTRNQSRLESYNTRNQVNRFTQIVGGNSVYNFPMGEILNTNTGMLTAHNVRGQMNYGGSRGQHEWNMLAGGEIRSAKNNQTNTEVVGYNDDRGTFSAVNMQVLYPVYGNLASPQFLPNRNNIGGSTLNFTSLFANGAYTYAGKYTVSGSVRKDASNLFGVATNQKGVPLWSAGLLWNLSKETFYNVSSLPWVQLRLTYGYSGNTSSNASALTTIQYSNGNGTITNQPYASVNTPSNPDLRWEQVGQLNAGLDIHTANKKLKLSVEYYEKECTDLLASTSLDPTRGFASAVLNTGSMRTRGVDLSIQTHIGNRKLSWNTFTIFNYNRSKITKYDLTFANARAYVNSETSLNAREGYEPYGLFAYRWGGLSAQNGNPLGYLNGELSSTYNQILSAMQFEELHYYGSGRPPFFGAFRNDISVGKWSLSANVAYEFGHHFRLNSINYNALFTTWHNHNDYVNRWQKPGDELITHIPSMVYPNVNNRDLFYLGSDVLIAPAANIRLQDIRLSWLTEKRSGSKLPFSVFECFAFVSNLGTLWVANDHGIDPRFNGNIPAPLRLSFGLRTDF